MNGSKRVGYLFKSIIAVSTVILSACVNLPDRDEQETVQVYLLEGGASITKPNVSESKAALLISPPRAAPGFDTQNMIYSQRSYELGYYQKHRWAATPPEMLAPLLLQTLSGVGVFRTVSLAPASTDADFQLTVDMVSLLQRATSADPVMELKLRANIVCLAQQRSVGQRLFFVTEPMTENRPYAAVNAANKAVDRALIELTEFLATTMGDSNCV